MKKKRKRNDEILPELKTGDKLVGRSGLAFRVRKVKRPLRDTGYDEPLYNLMWELDGVTGKREWTREELQEAGVRMV